MLEPLDVCFGLANRSILAYLNIKIVDDFQRLIEITYIQLAYNLVVGLLTVTFTILIG